MEARPAKKGGLGAATLVADLRRIYGRPGTRRAGGAVTLTNYDDYTMKPSETLLAFIIGSLALAAIGYVFFKSVPVMLLFATAGLYYPVMRRKERIRHRKAQLKLQFKQLLAALSSALSAGKSVETALQESLGDLRLLYPGPDAMIVTELEIMIRRLENGETVESALMLFAARTHVDDIEQFAEVFVTCKRTGGNLVQVIRRTAGLIQDKLDIEQDIQVMIAQKKFESRALTLAPVMMVALLSFSSPDYMEPLYRGAGRMIMCGALVMLYGCYHLTQKIMNIKL